MNKITFVFACILVVGVTYLWGSFMISSVNYEVQKNEIGVSNESLIAVEAIKSDYVNDYIEESMDEFSGAYMEVVG